MAVNLSPLGGVAAQFFNNDGVPLAGGLIYTYAAGTNTPSNTYTTGAARLPIPIQLFWIRLAVFPPVKFG